MVRIGHKVKIVTAIRCFKVGEKDRAKGCSCVRILDRKGDMCGDEDVTDFDGNGPPVS